jgi:hypothetical protein
MTKCYGFFDLAWDKNVVRFGISGIPTDMPAAGFKVIVVCQE